MNRLLQISVFLISLIILAGCENPNQSEFQPELVLNGQLNAGQPIDSIFITLSADITERYDTYSQKVTGAEVTINGVILEEYQEAPGVYYYPDSSYKVQNGETYRIEVKAGSKEVSSETTVPPPFEFISQGVSEGDTVKYIPGLSFFSDEFFTLTWPGYNGSKIFRVVSLADSADQDNFIKDDRSEAKLFKGEEKDRINPAMWWVASDYVGINWMFFNYTGWHNLIVSAMDDNYYNYRNGILFGEQGGQNFNNIVQNGYGLFASAASDTLRIFLVK